MESFDTVIIGGRLIDGSGSPARDANIGIRTGHIAYIGSEQIAGNQEIDARGLVVTPGFIDVHSHLDGNVTFESRLKPNSGHGVTATIMGNCGVGFAPCRPEDRAFNIALMEGVEDIPAAMLEAGIDWRWQSYPEYLDVLASGQYDMDIGGLVPHSCLRVWVMGERAIAGEPATASDLRVMEDLTREAISAGALGVGSTRLVGQKTLSGIHCPSLGADEAEYLAIARGLAAAGRGVLQIAPEFNQYPRAEQELAMIIAVAEQTGVQVTYSLKQTNQFPDGWKSLLEMTAAARSRAVRIAPQVLARPTGAIFAWECSFHRFARCPTWRETLAALPLPDRIERLARVDVRAALLDEALAERASDPERFDRMARLAFPVGDHIDYEPTPEDSFAALAERSGHSAETLMYDAMMARDGRGCILLASGNYASGDLEPAAAMFEFDGSIPGLGDAGAHCTVICDASSPTYMLGYWARDRTKGRRFPLEFVVRKLTRDCANLFGLNDRGVVEEGKRADLNLLDIDAIGLSPPHMEYDLPAGARRLVQPARGYAATLVAGEPVVAADESTDALPGRLMTGEIS